MRMSRAAFEASVARAMAELPDSVARYLRNVDVVVQDLPSPAQRFSVGSGRRDLLGLYEGTPQIDRSASYGFVLPDKITLFRMPILARCRTEAEVADEVRRTVLHELAHHFGIDDDRLEELSAY